jgi:hypothetical protein
MGIGMEKWEEGCGIDMPSIDMIVNERLEGEGGRDGEEFGDGVGSGIPSWVEGEDLSEQEIYSKIRGYIKSQSESSAGVQNFESPGILDTYKTLAAGGSKNFRMSKREKPDLMAFEENSNLSFQNF